MAKSAFDFSDVYRDLEDKIDKYMRDETTKEGCARVFADSTEENVYAKYVPNGFPRYEMPNLKIFRRRENDGLKDWHNYHVLNIGKMNMTVINETKGNAFWNPAWNPMAWDPFDPVYITDIIETGHGYNWQDSGIYRDQTPRPFMEQACNKYVDEVLLRDIHVLFFDD